MPYYLDTNIYYLASFVRRPNGQDPPITHVSTKSGCGHIASPIRLYMLTSIRCRPDAYFAVLIE